MWNRVVREWRIGQVFLLLALSSVSARAAAAPHYVFAHYMVCFATYGGDTTDGFKREIQQAQAAGIDGFVLDVGVWDDAFSYYKTRVALMYAAAEQLNTNFKLFFFVEFPQPDRIIDLVKTYAARTNTFRYQGKIVLSAWGMNDVPPVGTNAVDWKSTVLDPLAQQGLPICFVPHFWPQEARELPYYSDAQFLLERYGSFLDGLFLFGAAGLPAQLAQCNSNYSVAVHAAGKISMASVTPHYWGYWQYSDGRRYFESNGGEGIVTQWTAILTNQPDWVDLVTWNDFHESTYFSPVENPGLYFSQLASPVRNTHKAYLELSKNFISWFKTGQNPAIDEDALFYFYRVHPKSLVACDTNDPPVTVFYGNPQDSIFLTLRLTGPAQLEVTSGTTLSTNSLDSGLSQLTIPFSAGTQRFTLRRNGAEVLSTQGPDIVSSINNYDFFPASGFAYPSSVRPTPPTNMRAGP